jgi:hypothetical protein
LEMWEILRLYGTLWKEAAEAAAKRVSALESRIPDGLDDERSRLMKSAMARRIDLYLSAPDSMPAKKRQLSESHQK